MCIVIDANVASEFYGEARGECAAGITRWVNSGGKVVHGGKLTEELLRLTEFRRLMLAWQRAGRARTLSGSDIDVAAKEIIAIGKPGSNDLHVLAVVRAGRAKVIFTRDRELQLDIRRGGFLRRRCKILKQPDHCSRLLGRDTCP